MLAKAFMNVKSRFNLPLWARIRHSPFRSVDASVTLFQVRMTVPAQFHAKKSQDIDHDRTIHKVFLSIPVQLCLWPSLTRDKA